MPGQKSTTTITHKSGLQLVQVGDGRFVPFSGDIANIPSAASIARAPAEKVQMLLQNPGKASDFLDKYKYLPQEWWQAQTFHDKDVGSGGPGLQGPVRNSQHGSTFMDDYQKNHPGTGGVLSSARNANGASGGASSNEVETENAADDARADAEDEAADRAENPDDYAPAKEPG